MSKESLLYWIAAALFVAAAAIHFSKDNRVDLASVLMLVTAIVLAWIGMRKRERTR